MSTISRAPAVQHGTGTETDEVRSSAGRTALGVLRIVLGWTFLWAFLDKLLALGYATGVDPETGAVDRFGDAAWINGGSPTFGFLTFGADGPFKGFYGNLGGGSGWTADGRGVNRGSWLNINAAMELPTFDLVGLEAGLNLGGYDVREMDGTGIPLEREHNGFLVAFLESLTDPTFAADPRFAAP